MLPQRSEDERYVVKYSNGLDRGWLGFLFHGAVEAIDRATKDVASTWSATV